MMTEYDLALMVSVFVLGLAVGYGAWRLLERTIDRVQERKSRRRWMARSRPWWLR